MKKNILVLWNYLKRIVIGGCGGLFAYAVVGYGTRTAMMSNYLIIDNYLVSSRYWLIPLCMVGGAIYYLILSTDQKTKTKKTRKNKPV